LLRDELLNRTDFGTTSEIFSNDDLLAQLIIDCTKFTNTLKPSVLKSENTS
jgi:hypothetical protein